MAETYTWNQLKNIQIILDLLCIHQSTISLFPVSAIVQNQTQLQWKQNPKLKNKRRIYWTTKSILDALYLSAWSITIFTRLTLHGLSKEVFHNAYFSELFFPSSPPFLKVLRCLLQGNKTFIWNKFGKMTRRIYKNENKKVP